MRLELFPRQEAPKFGLVIALRTISKKRSPNVTGLCPGSSTLSWSLKVFQVFINFGPHHKLGTRWASSGPSLAGWAPPTVPLVGLRGRGPAPSYRDRPPIQTTAPFGDEPLSAVLR